MYRAMVALGNFDPGMSSLYYQQWMELLNFDGTATNDIMVQDQWMMLKVPLRIKFTET